MNELIIGAIIGFWVGVQFGPAIDDWLDGVWNLVREVGMR